MGMGGGVEKEVGGTNMELFTVLVPLGVLLILGIPEGIQESGKSTFSK